MSQETIDVKTMRFFHLRDAVTHPFTPAALLLCLAVGVGLSATVVSAITILVAWVVLALSAGYAISGSV